MSSDFDIDLLFRALDAKREARGLTWAGVAKEIEQRFAKVSPSTIKGIRDKQFVEGDGVLQMLLWLGEAPESFIPQFKDGRAHALAHPDCGVLRFDLQHTYRLLDSKRRQKKLEWEEVASQIGGMPSTTLRRFENGGRTSIQMIVRIARWLDLPVK